MKTNLSFWRWCMAMAVPIAWALAAGPVQAVLPVAMVTDLKGESSVTGEGEAVDLMLLAELSPGRNIALAENARLVIVYYESGSEFVFDGPASIQIGAETPKMLSGTRPRKRQVLATATDGEIIIRPVGMAQASLVMRGADANSDLRLVNLVGTKTLNRRPVFHWESLPGAETYHFELTDDGGESLMETDVTATELPLAGAVTLVPKITYTWELTTRTPDGALHLNWGDFTLATDDDRAQIKKLRPDDDASFSRRVVFAAALQHLEFRDEARRLWTTLQAERGDEPLLRERSAQ